jgi:DNA-binding IclR family transcriptional regulator
LTRGLEILDVLAQEESELSFASLKNLLNIPGPSLWRILNVLRETGYIIYDPERHSYRLGFKLLYMGNILLNRIGFRSEARETLKKLVSLTEETAELSARFKDELVLLDQVESPKPVRLYSRIGSTCPYFHATAAGKVYLAHMTEEKLQRVMARTGLPSITDFTQTDFSLLKKELKKIRAQGYAVDNQEMRLGVFRIASPVFDDAGRIIACLGVAGPSFRLDPDHVALMGANVKGVAEELSREVSRR